MHPSQILEYYQARESEIARLISEIVDIESPSHNASASRAVADWVEEQARASGGDLEIERMSVDDGDHISIRTVPKDGQHVLVIGHTDTVHPIGTNVKNPTRAIDDRLYGCGIFDMKSGIVLMLEALKYFASTGIVPARPIRIVLSCDEEIGSFTGRSLIERESEQAEVCLVFEPSAAGKVKTGRKGTGMFTLTAHGVPAHAGLEPDKGANAIVEISRQIDVIHQLADARVGTTVNVTTISGGTATNVIPEHAQCEIDVRFSSIAEAERVDAAIRSLTPFDKRVSLSVSGGINRPPMERTVGVIELFERAREKAASFGYALEETQVGGGSDGNFVAALGVPVLDGLGIAGDGAHTLDEHILISDIAKRATLITLLLM
ncbi:MAG: M20 family metallopeptidase [Pyrinomonadaceae bacterium]